MHHVAGAIIGYKANTDANHYRFTCDSEWITGAGMKCQSCLHGAFKVTGNQSAKLIAA
jgi:hypothetical protein